MVARKTNIRDVLAGNIRKALHDQSLAINSLADYAGVSRSQLYDVLSSRKGASIDWIDKVADVLGMSSADLLRDRGGMVNGQVRGRRRAASQRAG